MQEPLNRARGLEYGKIDDKVVEIGDESGKIDCLGDKEDDFESNVEVSDSLAGNNNRYGVCVGNDDNGLIHDENRRSDERIHKKSQTLLKTADSLKTDVDNTKNPNLQKHVNKKAQIIEQDVSKNISKTGQIPKNKYLLQKLESFNRFIKVKKHFDKENINSDNRSVLKDTHRKTQENSTNNNYCSKDAVNHLIHNFKELNVCKNNEENIINTEDKNVPPKNRRPSINTSKQERKSPKKEIDSKLKTEQRTCEEKIESKLEPTGLNINSDFKDFDSDKHDKFNEHIKSNRLAKYKHILSLSSNLNKEVHPKNKSKLEELKTNINQNMQKKSSKETISNHHNYHFQPLINNEGKTKIQIKKT